MLHCVILFQSLFWWILLLNNLHHIDIGLSKFRFQSLFWWILLLNQIHCYCLYYSYQPVSILVLVDFALKRDFPHHFFDAIYMFQSLFWWILLLYPKSFRVHLLFLVSILVLVDFALKRKKCGTRHLRLLVSILVLVDFALKLK